MPHPPAAWLVESSVVAGFCTRQAVRSADAIIDELNHEA